jgi:hypothetical protein
MTPIARTLAVLLAFSIALGLLFALRWREAVLQADATLEWAHAALDSARRATPGPSARASDFEALGPLAKLADPVSAIRESLAAHPELIPYPGIEGGTMGFYAPDAIVVLPPRYVFASFEDGHVGGSMLLSFRVPGPGPILWRRLWAERE